MSFTKQILLSEHKYNALLDSEKKVSTLMSELRTFKNGVNNSKEVSHEVNHDVIHEQPIDIDTKFHDKSHGKMSLSDILMGIPKKYHHKAESILHFITKDNLIDYDSTGQVTIKGVEIKGSHISDLIRQLLIPFKKRNVIGFDQFLSVLHTSRIPKTLIPQSQIGGSNPNVNIFPPPGEPVLKVEKKIPKTVEEKPKESKPSKSWLWGK